MTPRRSNSISAAQMRLTYPEPYPNPSTYPESLLMRGRLVCWGKAGHQEIWALVRVQRLACCVTGTIPSPLCASVSPPSLQIRGLPSDVKAKACDPFPILTKENPSYAIPAFQEPFRDAKASSSYAFTKSSPQA